MKRTIKKTILKNNILRKTAFRQKTIFQNLAETLELMKIKYQKKTKKLYIAQQDKRIYFQKKKTRIFDLKKKYILDAIKSLLCPVDRKKKYNNLLYIIVHKKIKLKTVKQIN